MGFFCQINSTMWRQIKPQDSFKTKQIIAQVNKITSLTPRNHGSVGQRSLFLLLPTRKGPPNIQSDRQINQVKYKGLVPCDNKTFINPPPMYEDSLLGREVVGRRSGLLVKSTVQYSDELNHFLATKISK